MIHNHWLSMINHDPEPLAQHNKTSFTPTGSAQQTMIHNHWFGIAHHDSQPLGSA
jgi:hypothetical protein